MKIDGKIGGVVFRHVATDNGISYVEGEAVVEITLKSHEDTNSSHIFVLSKAAARELAQQLHGQLINL